MLLHSAIGALDGCKQGVFGPRLYGEGDGQDIAAWLTAPVDGALPGDR